MPASTPSVTASCPPTAPMATAKVTDDLLIARYDRYLGTLIAAALSMAFDWADPFAAPWLELAPGVCSSLTYCTPNLLRLCRLCFLISLWCFQGSSCMLLWGACFHGFPSLSERPSVEPVFLSTLPLPSLQLARHLVYYLVRQVLLFHFIEESAEVGPIHELAQIHLG